MAPPLISQNDGERQLVNGGPVRRPRPVVPVVPRALERKHARSSTQTSTTPSNVAKFEPEPKSGSRADAAGANDWASMVGEEQENGQNGQIGQADAIVSRQDVDKVSTANFEKEVDSVSGDFGKLHIEGSSLKNEPEKPVVSMPYMNGTLSNGVSHTFYPESVSSSQRFDPEIVFGGSIVSNQSSPIMPPSASSTNYTQPTPVSDTASTHSQPLYQGYSHAPPVLGSMPPQMAPIMPHPPPPPPPPAAAAAAVTEPLPKPQLPNGIGAQYDTPPRRPPMIFEHQGLLSPVANLEALQSYLSRQFNEPLLADCVLDLQTQRGYARLFLHGVIVARAPTVQRLLASSGARDANGKISIALKTKDMFVTIPALVSALRTCYGSYPSVAPPSPTMGSPTLSEAHATPIMEHCISSIAAGHILQLPDVAMFATESACQILDHTNLESALAFALATPYNSQSIASDYDLSSPAVNAAYTPYSEELVRSAMVVLLSNISGSFTLDTLAPHSPNLGGIPNTPDTPDIGHKRMSSHPRLSLIQFGELSSPTDDKTTLISTILLSAPFEFLYHLLRMLAQKSLSKAIIHERERRRVRYLKRGAGEGESGAEGMVIQARLGWEEGIDDSGITITRRWVGD